MTYQLARQQKSGDRSLGLSAMTLLRASLLLLLAAAPLLLSTRLMRSSLASEPASAPSPTKAEIADQYGKLPLSFEGNEGQTDPEVKFISHGPGYELFLTATGAVLTLRQPRPQAGQSKLPLLTEKGPGNQPPNASVLRLKMIGANPQARTQGEEPLPGKINYLIGNDPQKWHLNIPTYRKVYYTEIYPKIDLVYYGNGTELEFDFVVALGGDVRAIRFRVEEADRMTLDEAGDLHLAVKQSEITLRKPVIYQLTDQGDRREVKGEYVIKGKEVRFKTEVFDAQKPLIIDPVLSYSTMLGGGSHEYASGIAVDSSGNAYITGYDQSGGFPTTPGAFQTNSSFFSNAFVTKLDPTGSTLVYSTYLNGDGFTTGTAIAVDSSGNAYVTGRTNASDFPTVNPFRSSTANFYKSTDSGGQWNSQVIGAPGGAVNILAIDPLAPNTMYAGMWLTGVGGIYKTTDAGNTWTALNTGLTNAFCRALAINPTTPSTLYASLGTNGESQNSGLYKSTDGGSSWAILTNGLSGVNVSALAIDPSSPNTLYAGGSSLGAYKSTDGGASWVNSSTGINFGGTSAIAVDPVTPQNVYLSAGGGGVFKSTNGGGNWAQVNNGLTTTNVRTLNIDPASTVYAGTSGGGVFKSTNGGTDWTAVNNGISGYIQVSSLALSPSASSTLYLGTGDGRMYRTTDGGSNWTKVYETLTRTSFTAMAIHPVAASIVYAGAYINGGSLNDDEAFVSKLNATGSGLIYSTYLGGSGDDFGQGIAVDSAGSAVVVGQTVSSSFPTLNAFQSALSGANDAFVTKFNPTGNALVYSSYLGGSGTLDNAYGVAVNGAGSAFVTGRTNSANFPTLNAFQSTIADTFGGDVFVTKVNGNGALAYSTFLGGPDADIGWGIAVDSTGSAYVTGQAGGNFPLVNPIQPTGGGDAFVTKLNSTGSGLIYSTYIGGSDQEVGRGIATDSAGNAYVTGTTGSTDFPVLPGALRTKSPFFRTTDGGGNWNNDTYGLKSNNVSALAVDPFNPLTIYAGTYGSVFKSTDSGQSWGAINSGLVQPSVVELVVDPLTPLTVYMAASFSDFNNSRGVYKSTNGGNTWTAANLGLSNMDMMSLAIDPVTPSNLYAGVNGSGIYKSTNGGNSWALQASQTLSYITTFAIDPATPTTVYSGGINSNGGIFKSTDGGINWQRTTPEFRSQFSDEPGSPLTVYAGAEDGALKSTNGGASWASINTGLPAGFINTIRLDPFTQTTLYGASSGLNGGIFKSTDSGNNWIGVNRGLTYPFVSCLVINPQAPAKIYAGVNVYPSDDDAFVVKLNPSGTTLLYSTYLGGNRAPGDSSNLNDEGYAIAVDSAGNAYVAGATRSPDFPVTPNAYQPFNRGFTDAFVSKLTMSYIISGRVLDANNAPVSGASVVLDDGVSLNSVVTESDGAYQFVRLREGGNFTVSAAKPQFIMTPPSQSFINLQSNQTVNFLATPTNAPFYTISGLVTNKSAPLAGVSVTLSGSQPGVTTTDNNGAYSFTLAGGNYTLMPSLLGFVFTPPSLTFTNLSADQTADFAATRQNFMVTSANDHGAGTLRQAIMDANASPGMDTIVFNISGAGIHTINLLLELPEISDPVVIDAATQPGYAGTPLIVLDGFGTNANAGLRISAGGSTIRGFVINRFNSGPGIQLVGGSGNVIQGNYIGTDATGTVGRSNNSGIGIFNSSDNLIGGTTAAARNVISGNGFDGIELNGSGNRIQGNYIGTNASGTAALPNGIDGIEIVNFQGSTSTNNMIGGTVPGAGNLISGNQRGVYSFSSGIVIQGNLIGTNATGTAAIGNGTGISVSGTDILIGGTVPGARNIISGNSLGVAVGGMQSRLQGNFIGTDITGTLALGNTSGGVTAGGQALIGGTTPEARNIISGNGGANVNMGGAATVQGNYIGTDVTGTVALANPANGISVNSFNNLIGGTVPGAGNVIAGNRVGVQIGGGTSATVTGNLVQGNLIGLNATGNAPLPNLFDGVALSNASGNTIGGEGNAGNTLAFNGRNGVRVWSGTGNSILRNSIFSNGALGIDLNGDGVTANDAGDGDTGANDLQNLPILTSAINNGLSTSIRGTLNSTANSSFMIEFFSNTTCDSTGNGEGQTFIGAVMVTTDGNGNASCNTTLPLVVPMGQFITATATDSSKNTSEFSPCVQAAVSSLLPTSQSFSPAGGNGSLNVFTQGSWTATSNDLSWVTITSGGSGNGNGTVTFSVASHSGSSPRSTTLTINNETFTVLQGGNFADVPPGHPFYNEIGKLFARGVTLGCGGGNYCPDQIVTREQMAAFIMRARGEFNPPTPGSQRFLDVPPSNPFYNFIDRMAILQITLGCGDDNYCPTNPVLREQMAAFLIRALHEPGYVPPVPPSQRFDDVPASNLFYGHIEEMAVRGITLGCSATMYCPAQSVTRAQMAAFLVRAFNL